MRKTELQGGRHALPEPDPTVEEVGAYFGVCPATVYNWMAAGTLESYKAGRCRRITRESVEQIRRGTG